MKKKIIALSLTVASFAAVAQQDAQFSQNMFNKLPINPAYAGMNKALCATALYRSQWVSFPGQPKTGLLNVDFGPILHGGVGLTLVNDQLGFDKSNMVLASYSFHQVIGVGTLGIGVQAGMLQKTLSGNWVPPTSTNDPSIPGGGGSNSSFNKITYDVGFGLYYEIPRKMYVGLSSTHLPQQDLKGKGSLKSVTFEMARHYYVMAGYQAALNADWALLPSILVKSDASSTQFDGNLLVEYQEMVWAGASYRLTDAIVALAGFKFKNVGGGNLKIGMAYDVTTSQIKNYSNNTWEVMLGYCINVIKPPKPQSHRNVRFL